MATTYTVLRLVCGGTTVDLNDVSSRVLNRDGFAPVSGELAAVLNKSAFQDGAELVFATRDLINYQIAISQKAGTHDALWSLVVGIEKILQRARRNQWMRQFGWTYTPVYFEFASTNATNVSRTEVVYGKWNPSRSAFGNTLAANRLEGDVVSLWCRPFLDKSGLTAALTTTSINNGIGNAVTIPALLGVDDAPCQITVNNINAGSDDTLFVAVRQIGTPANFTAAYEMESATLHSTVYWNVSIIDAAAESGFSPGSSNVGIEIEPTSAEGSTASEVPVATLTQTVNVQDQYGAFKVLVRGNAINNTNIGLRGRFFAQSGSLTKQYGPFWTTTARRMKAAGEIAMLDLTPTSPALLPVLDTRGAPLLKFGIELYAQVTSITGSPKLRLDYLLLLPVGDGEFGGAFYAAFPAAFRATGINRAVFDSRDFQPRAGLYDATPTLLYTPVNFAGRGIYLPTDGCKIYFLLLTGTNWTHDYTRTFDVKVDYVPRYPSVIGTT